MAYLSQVTLPNNTIYNLKDSRISDTQISNWDSIEGAFSYHAVVGDGTTTSFNFTHNLGTENIIVSINITDANDNTYIAPMGNLVGLSQIGYSVTVNDEDSITVKFTEAPITNGANISIISIVAYTIASEDSLLLIDHVGEDYLRIG